VNTCDTCKFHQLGYFILQGAQKGYNWCNHSKMAAAHNIQSDDSMLICDEVEGASGMVITGPKFGCILHQPK
jgi:hypothetical protein